MLTNTHYTALLIGCLLIFGSCERESAPAMQTTSAEDTATALLGTWETVEVEVDYASYNGEDTTAHEIIREGDFSRLYGAKPPRTVFTPDGKHRRTHRLVDGRTSDIVNGLWKVHNADTLLFIEPNVTLYYAFDLTGDRLTLNGLEDADFDKEVDDKKRTVMRLVARATYRE